jgi:hypothetical protein
LNNILYSLDGYSDRWDEEIVELDPNEDIHLDYDPQLQVIQRQALRRCTTDTTTCVNLFQPDNIETYVDNEHFQLRSKLITHYSVARLKKEITWLK